VPDPPRMVLVPFWNPKPRLSSSIQRCPPPSERGKPRLDVLLPLGDADTEKSAIPGPLQEDGAFL